MTGSDKVTSMVETAPAHPAQAAPQECTACKLWAQASAAFRNEPRAQPSSERRPVEVEQAPGPQAEPQAPAQGGVHAIPGHDCMACRVSGTVVSLGCSAFLATQLYKRPAPVGAHRAAIIAFAGGFAVLGVLRAAV